MPRVIFTTVGRSLEDSALCWKGLQDFDASQEEQRKRAEWKRRNLMGPVLNDPTSAADLFCADRWSKGHLRALPAELASLYLIDDRLQLTNEDEVVLLHGEDIEAIAQALESILSRGGTNGSPLTRANVKLCSYGLADPGSKEAFLDASKEAWKNIRERIDGDCEVVLNLTGGYKGMLVNLALEVQAYLLGRAANVVIYYLYEESADLIDIPKEQKSGLFCVPPGGVQVGGV